MIVLFVACGGITYGVLALSRSKPESAKAPTGPVAPPPDVQVKLQKLPMPVPAPESESKPTKKKAATADAPKRERKKEWNIDSPLPPGAKVPPG
jgi:hypothetical protein